MKYLIIIGAIIFQINSYAQNKNLQIVIIRHGEKPKVGDNLNCKGFNRSLLLPNVIVQKFGVPNYNYVPAVVGNDSTTKHSRMFQTITPLLVKYNLSVNSVFNGKDSAGVAKNILQKKGTILVVWDHKSIVPMVHSLGITDASLIWADDDFDSIWIIKFIDGKAILVKDKENILPDNECK